MTQKILVTLERGIKRITINRPERKNSVDFETFELLRDAVLAARDEAPLSVRRGRACAV